jgi:hypothetical protein
MRSSKPIGAHPERRFRSRSDMFRSFGGFASKYIKGKFFMDVHPPLAKLLITLAGWLAGFNGEFDFKEIGKDYVEPGVPYVAMRLLPAIMGVLTIPTIFLTLKASGCRTTTAAMGAALLIFGSLRLRIGDVRRPHPSLLTGWQRTGCSRNLDSSSWTLH